MLFWIVLYCPIGMQELSCTTIFIHCCSFGTPLYTTFGIMYHIQSWEHYLVLCITIYNYLLENIIHVPFIEHMLAPVLHNNRNHSTATCSWRAKTHHEHVTGWGLRNVFFPSRDAESHRVHFQRISMATHQVLPQGPHDRVSLPVRPTVFACLRRGKNLWRRGIP